MKSAKRTGTALRFFNSGWNLRMVPSSRGRLPGCAQSKTCSHMNDQQRQFMTLAARLPARQTAEQTSWLINCPLHAIPVLVAAQLLRPLGNPKQNSPKYFAAIEVLEHSNDRAWLAKMTTALHKHWLHRNQQKGNSAENDAPLE